MLTDSQVGPFEVFQIYSSLSLHFSGKYDAVKYNFKTPIATRQKFESHRFRFVFEKIARKYSTQRAVVLYFVSNFVSGNTFIATMSDDIYVKWTGLIESFTYKVKGELSTLCTALKVKKIGFDDSLKVGEDKQLPLIIDLLNSGIISLETVTCIDSLTGFISDAVKTSKDSLGILSHFSTLFQKYRPFLHHVIDLEKVRQLVIIQFTSA
jgi:hypothetical protein